VTVQVSNSTGQDGLGATAATELQQHGFNVETPDTYASSLSETTVFFSPGNEEAAATVASAFADPTIERVGGKRQNRAGSARLGLQFGEPAEAQRIIGAGTRPSRRIEQPDAAARRPVRHERRRHHLRLATAFSCAGDTWRVAFTFRSPCTS
jgi:hypothetical protein